MKQTDYSQSGQSLVEYGLLIFLVVSIVASVFLLFPAVLIYLYMRQGRHLDRRTAFLMAVGFTLVIGLINAYLSQGRQCNDCAKARCCTQECNCCEEECSCCSKNCRCGHEEEPIVAEPV
jgi:Flp pilus assembly protein TadB